MKINAIFLFILLSSNTLLAIQKDSTLEQESSTKGLIVLDYEIISLADNKSIDLLGTHYLQQINEWLYFGFGMHAPLVKGDYGGFMTLDATLHLQRKIIGDIFINGGLSLGGGGGGASIEASKELSGQVDSLRVI
ncbi:hypothetical protein [Sulfurimonas sp.]|uniref:hypothetical protein n=1 Tax=Sulfurimonas sp. TaxID=2022749 RepID=UPI002612A607|nr:hypothetical protein [Sulfurimonas sp.]